MDSFLLAKEFIYKVNSEPIIFQLKPKLFHLRANLLKSRSSDFDVELKISTRQVAVIKFTQEVQRLDINLDDFLKVFQARYIVISNGQQFQVLDRYSRITVSVELNQFLSLMIKVEEISTAQKYEIASFIYAYMAKSKLGKMFSGIEVRKIYEQIEFDSLYEYFSFKHQTISENIELWLFNTLFGSLREVKKIYRYTTFNSLRMILTENTFRLNGLSAMNDKSEIDFIASEMSDVNLEHWTQVEKLNQIFISSFSIQNDDLSMWRLYSEDAKGVCLEFEVNDDAISEEHMIGKVHYIDDPKRDDKLKFLFRFFKDFQMKFRFPIRLKMVDIWMHFFKPSDYSVEKEVRLIIKSENKLKQWFIAYPSLILAPYINIDLANHGSNTTSTTPKLPMKLTRIILGPKFPEHKLNQKQIQQIIREQNNKFKSNGVDSPFSGVKVYKSKIKNYR